ncbi:MAG TPA: hypothetical protein VD788_10335, partial [Candidatus Polarisedimenticolaceae bacterium]|nr:hypothetical protein [Candidatus Polarisedimenticolaceae bacterium]
MELGPGEVADRAQRVGVRIAERASPPVENVRQQRLRLVVATRGVEGQCESVLRRERVRVIGSREAQPRRQRLAVQPFRFRPVAAVVVEPGQPVARGERQRSVGVVFALERVDRARELPLRRLVQAERSQRLAEIAAQPGLDLRSVGELRV